MRISKIDIVNGTYGLMRISGITVQPSPADIVTAIQVADDLAAQFKVSNLDTGWIQPDEYGASDPNDNSGLTIGLAGAFKKVLMFELLPYFGKPLTDNIVKLYQDGMRTIEQYSVTVPDAQFGSTLPMGSGTELDNNWDSAFFNTPTDPSAERFIVNEVTTYQVSFSDFVLDESLDSVTWVSSDGGLVVSGESFTETTATAQLAFNRVGQYTVCLTATKTNSTDKKIIERKFIVREC